MAFPSVLQRMHNRLLTRLGGQAVLRGNVSVLANVEYGVVVNMEIGDDKFVRSEYAGMVDIANILSEHAPKPGDAFTIDGKTYTIDAIAADNGYLTRCVLV